jgi:acetyl esterase
MPATVSAKASDAGIDRAIATHGFAIEPVDAVDDVLVAIGQGSPVRIRIYRPDGYRPGPVVIWAHGGFWTQLSVEILDGYFRVLANRSGAAIVAVDYRLAPQARFPVALNEIHRAAQWVRKEASALGFDDEKIAIGGDCTGGNLAAAATLLDRDRSEIGYVHQLLIVPLLDARLESWAWAEMGEGFMLTHSDVAAALATYAPRVDRDHPLLSPLAAPSFAGLPPALIVTGQNDPLRDDGRRYAIALADAGVDVTHVTVPGLIHHAIALPRLIELGGTVIEDAARALGQKLEAGFQSRP